MVPSRILWCFAVSLAFIAVVYSLRKEPNCPPERLRRPIGFHSAHGEHGAEKQLNDSAAA